LNVKPENQRKGTFRKSSDKLAWPKVLLEKRVILGPILPGAKIQLLSKSEQSKK